MQEEQTYHGRTACRVCRFLNIQDLCTLHIKSLLRQRSCFKLLKFVVFQETSFSYVELNASDTRSKRSLQEDVSEALNNHTLVDFFGENFFFDFIPFFNSLDSCFSFTWFFFLHLIPGFIFSFTWLIFFIHLINFFHSFDSIFFIHLINFFHSLD